MIDIDPLDLNILKILEKNPRIANTEIAKRLGISEGTVRKRIKKLEKNRKIKNVAVIDPETLGYTIHLHVGVQVEYKKLKQVAQALKEKEPIYFVGLATGRYDLILVAFFRTIEDQYKFFTEEISAIDGIVRTETSNILKMVQTRHLWGLSISELSK